jgi:hypothetical protein
MREKGSAHSRQLDTLRHFLDQLCAQGRLQPAQALTQRRLAQAKGLRCAADIAALRYCHEVLNVAELDRHNHNLLRDEFTMIVEIIT